MPCEYTIDPGRRMVYSRAWGDLTSEELLSHQQRLSDDPLLTPDCWQIFDATAVTSTRRVHSSTPQRMSNRHVFGPRSRRAFVTRERIGYGLARMFQTYRELAGGHEQIRVFDDLAEARSWLGLDDIGPRG